MTALTLVLLGYFLLSNNVYGQCSGHSPTENGKNLQADMIKHPPHRWYDEEMTFRVRQFPRSWYDSDITHAVDQWNNSSYQGTNSSFTFIDGGSTNAPADYPDLINVIGILHMTNPIAAQAHTRVYSSGEIYECDININSLSWTDIQPHSLAGSNDYCVRSALCHEFGHALGLSHMGQNTTPRWTKYKEDTMYDDLPRGEHKKESLECDDKWGTYWLYDSGNVQSPNAPSIKRIEQGPEDLMRIPLIRGTVPTVTELVGNYPNPFNPETWIAYTLAEESKVKVHIYAAEGYVIRNIDLGRKSAGFYVDKESAIYWDGKTDTGSTVASGIYFYSLFTDSSIFTRRMVILK